MSQAETLLNSITEAIPAHTHPVPDTDTYFVIDPISRKIENTNRNKSVIMQYDHNSERFTFELPRYIDGHDMLECTSITVNVDNIEVVDDETMVPRVNPDAPDITDLRLHPSDPEKVICSWLISRNSTQLAGILSFSIEFKCVDSNDNVVYEWSTDDYDEIEVKARKKNGEAAVSEYSDVLEQWRSQIFGAGNSVMANIAAEGEAQVSAVKAESEIQQEAVELKGAQTLDSIPEDYTEVDAMADEAVRTKGDAIICEVAGESVVLNDSSDDHIRGLKLFGKSTQITTTGKNLLPFSYKDLSKTENGVTLTVNGDGSISFSGTATGYAGVPLYEGYTSVFPSVITIFALGVFSNAVLHIVLVDKNGSTILETNLTGAAPYRTIDFSQYTDVERITINAKRYDAGAVSGTIYPMIVSGEMNSATYEPYTGGKPSPNPDYPQDIVSIENPTMDLFGKNLAHPVGNVRVVNGYTLTPNADGTMTVSGAAIAAVDTVIDLALIMATSTYEVTRLEPNVHYTLTCWKNGQITETPGTKQILADGSIKWGWTGIEDQERVITKLYRQFVPEIGDTDICGTYAIQIEVGTEHTEYTPYVNQQLVVTHTLPGIPVSEGGNYTDSDDQQWICDEIDLERGVYIQRVNKYVVTGEEQWTTSLQQPSTDGHTRFDCGLRGVPAPLVNDAICTHAPWNGNTNPKTGVAAWVNDPGIDMLQIRLLTKHSTVEELTEYLSTQYEAGTPVTYYYVLIVPIETPLTAEENTAFKALRTNYPNTTILNDAGAWMSVKYNADTKTYVENPKTLKLVDSSTGVVYELKIVDGNLTVAPV